MKKLFSSVLVLCCIILLTQTVYAEPDEEKVSILTVELGMDWAGTQWQLKTDYGSYPEQILADDYGSLRMEIGGSKEYIISCVDPPLSPMLKVEYTFAPSPTPVPTLQPATPVQIQVSGSPPESDNPLEAPTEPQRIPALHLVLFISGVLLSGGTLIFLWLRKRRRYNYGDEEYEDDDDENGYSGDDNGYGENDDD